MGWSSWYGFTQNINETMLREMGEGMISSGLHSVGYEHVWLDDGWAVAAGGLWVDGWGYSGGRRRAGGMVWLVSVIPQASAWSRRVRWTRRRGVSRSVRHGSVEYCGFVV